MSYDVSHFLDIRLLTLLLVLTPNVPRACADIVILDDSIVENREFFRLVLSSNSSNVEFTRSFLLISIQDNDCT